jgi:hypothetical protein
MAEVSDEEFRKYLESPPTPGKEVEDANIAGFDITEAPIDPLAVYRALRPQHQTNPNQMGVVRPQPQMPMIASMTAPGTLGGQLIAKSPQIAGGTIGGAVGAVIPTLGEEGALAAGGSALGNYLLGPMFAAAGGTAGRMTTLSRGDPEYGKKLMFAALEEGLGELGGRLLSAGAGRFLRPFRRSVEPGAEAADKILRAAGRRPIPTTRRGKVADALRHRFMNLKEFVKNAPGGDVRMADEFGAHLLPGQSTESIMDTIQGLSEGSFVSGGKLRRFRNQRIPAALNNATKQLKQSVRRNLINEVGEKRASAIIADLSNADAKTINTIEKGLYEAVDQLKGTPIDIRPLKQFAEANRGRGLKPGARERMLRQAANKPDVQTFDDLRTIRRDAWQEREKFLRAGAGADARTAKQIAEIADDLMEQAAKSGPPELESAFRTADAFHRGKLRTEWLESTLIKTAQGDEAPGKAFANKITKMAAEPNNRPSELAKMGFSTDEISRIQGVANAAVFARKQAEGGGRMLIQLAQGGAIIQLGGGLLAAGGAAADSPGAMWTGVGVMLAPEVAARMMLNPTGARLLSTGLRAPVGSRTVGTLGTRVLREAAYHAMQVRQEGGDGRLVFIRRDPVTKQEMAMRKKREKVPEQIRRQMEAPLVQQTVF